MTDLLGNQISPYKFNYNIDSNRVNTGTISIKETKKKQIKDYIPSPRKVDVIISKIRHRRIGPQEPKKYTLEEIMNNNNNITFVNESRKTKKNYSQRNNDNYIYDSNFNKTSYEPMSYNKINDEEKDKKSL